MSGVQGAINIERGGAGCYIRRSGEVTGDIGAERERPWQRAQQVRSPSADWRSSGEGGQRAGRLGAVVQAARSCGRWQDAGGFGICSHQDGKGQSRGVTVQLPLFWLPWKLTCMSTVVQM